MSVLMLLWWTALALAAAAIGWMSLLIVGRYFRTRREARYTAERAAVDDALVALLRGDVGERRRLVTGGRSVHALAEALVEVLTLVRGPDRERLLTNLRGLGIDDLLRATARRGRPDTRLLCIEALVAFPDKQTEAVLRGIAVSPGHADHRLAAVRALAEIGAELSVDRLLDAMIHDGLVASGPVIELLHTMGRARPGELEAALGREDLTPAVRPLVVEAFGETGDYGLIPVLIEATSDKDMEVRAAAVRALGKLAHPAAEPALARALADEAWPVRALAADAAGRSGLVSLVEPLTAALSDPAWWVRHRAAGGLARLGPAGLKRLGEVSEAGQGVAQLTAAMALAERNA